MRSRVSAQTHDDPAAHAVEPSSLRGMVAGTHVARSREDRPRHDRAVRGDHEGKAASRAGLPLMPWHPQPREKLWTGAHRGRGQARQRYAQMSEQWRLEQDKLMQEIIRHQAADRSYLDEGAHLIELAHGAHRLFARQDPQEQRRLLNFVLSNSSWTNGKLMPVFRQPFDLIGGIKSREKSLIYKVFYCLCCICVARPFASKSAIASTGNNPTPPLWRTLVGPSASPAAVHSFLVPAACYHSDLLRHAGQHLNAIRQHRALASSILPQSAWVKSRYTRFGTHLGFASALSGGGGVMTIDEISA